MKIDRQKIFDKYHGRCAYCGHALGSIKEMQVDHIIAQRHMEGPRPTATYEQVHCEDNLMPSCRSCNKHKDTFSIEQFRQEIACQPHRLRKYRPTFRIAERYGLIVHQDKQVVFYFETVNTTTS